MADVDADAPVAAHVVLVHRLARRAGTIADELADAVAASAPPQWRTPLDRECRPVTRLLIAEALTCLAEGSRPTPESLAAVHASAGRNRAAGIPATVTMRAMGAALTSFVRMVRVEAEQMRRARAETIAAIATLTARAPMVVFEIMAVFVAGHEVTGSHEVIGSPADDRADRGLHPMAREVLKLTAQGLTTRETAVRLRCSPSNVSYHLAELRRRYDAPNRAALVARAAAALSIDQPVA